MAFGKPFTKGVSGNPGGRAKGLERLVREAVGDDIIKIITVHAQLARGVVPDGIKIKELSARDMAESAKFVTDRGWGKARQTVDMTADVTTGRPLDMSKCTDEQLRLLAELDVDLAFDDGEQDPPNDEPAS